MQSKTFMMLILTGALLAAWPARAAANQQPLQVVPSVDLARYAGRWYEIARLPNRCQKDCASKTTATYALRPDGNMTVVNDCRKANGSRKSAKGTARVANASGPNTKLKVSFFGPSAAIIGSSISIRSIVGSRWANRGEGISGS